MQFALAAVRLGAEIFEPRLHPSAGLTVADYRQCALRLMMLFAEGLETLRDLMELFGGPLYAQFELQETEAFPLPCELPASTSAARDKPELTLTGIAGTETGESCVPISIMR